MPKSRKTAVPAASPPSGAMMDTREVADYLRLKERRIYHLVQRNAMPYVRATGKLLFPRAQIDAWLATKAGVPIAPGLPSGPAPAIVAGSHDPLLDWAARESRSGLAVLACGSSAGLDRLVAGEAMLAALHWLDSATGEYNVPLVRERLAGHDVVVIEWARRVQGLVLAHGNPLRIRGLRDLAQKKARIISRQREAGSHRLLEHLLARERIAPASLQWVPRPALAETDLAAAIEDDRADAGVAIEAAARVHNLEFLPLTTERLDLVVRRRDYFEPPAQALLGFARTAEFTSRAATLGGYDVARTGRVVFNG